MLNLGLIEDLEAVVDFKDQIGLERVSGQSRVRLLDTDTLLKWIIRRGTLQEEKGVSIAVEGGPLLPEINGEKHFGAQLNLIFSYRAPFGTAHINEQAAYSRRQNLDLFSNLILEGPHDWKVRPVGEVFVEHEFGEPTTYSALVGGIWEANDSFVVDLGLRAARTDNLDALEVRLGFTWSIAIWNRDRPAKVND